MPERPETFALEAAKQALDQQGGVLAELRGRASTLLAAASLTTAFLGAVALKDERVVQRVTVADRALDGWEWVGLGAFALLGLCVLTILWPWKWKFRIDPDKVIEGYVDHPNRKSVHEIERNFAIYMGQYYTFNAGQLRWLFWAFRLGSVCLVVQVVAWIMDLT